MSKHYTVLLSFTLALFVCLVLMLCYFNRLATDDYYFIWDVRNHGIVTGVTSQYMEWCGRFAATFFMDLFYKLFDVNYIYYSFFPFVSAFLLFAGIYFLLGNFAITVSKQQKVFCSASFTALLFFLSVDIGESWFWFCGQSSYLWSIIAFVWGCVFLSNQKYAILSTIGAVICFIYVGGSSEVYSVIFGIFFTVLLFRNYRRSINISTFLRSNNKLLIVYVVFAISFIIFLIAPGNYLRDGLFPEHKFLYSFFITAKSFVKFGIFYLPFKLPYIFIFATPFLLLGDSCKSYSIKFFSSSFKSFFYKTSLGFFAILFIFYLLVAYVMVETGPPRIVFLVSFLLSIYACIVFFYAGYKGLFNIVKLRIIQNVSVLLGIGLMLFFIIQQYSITSNYSKANDARIAYVTDLNKTIEKDTLIILAPLPPSGMLYSTEIANDTTHFTNRELRLGYNLKFHVVVNR